MKAREHAVSIEQVLIFHAKVFKPAIAVVKKRALQLRWDSPFCHGQLTRVFILDASGTGKVVFENSHELTEKTHLSESGSKKGLMRRPAPHSSFKSLAGLTLVAR